MRNWFVRHRRPVTATFLILVVLTITIPCPLRGNYVGRLTTSHGCNAHAFVRFADGQVTYYHETEPPRHWGSYERTGWRTYIWKSSNGLQPIHVGWFFVTMEAGPFLTGKTWIHRDYRVLKDSRMIRDLGSRFPKEKRTKG